MPANLESYLSKWSLSGPQPLAQTSTSTLYTVQAANGPAVLKIFSGTGAEDEKGAAAALRWFDGHGAVQLWNHDDGALLLEYIDGGNLTTLVRDNQDDAATQIIVDVLKELHRKNRGHAVPPGLISLEQRFSALFKKAAEDRHGDSIFVRGAVVARQLLADPSSAHVLHGDIHHENIRHDSARGWLAFDPKGLVGDRAYDAANALCNPNSLPDIVLNRERLLRQADILAGGLGINRARLLSYVFVHAGLWACWSVEDGDDPGYGEAMAKIAESCLNG